MLLAQISLTLFRHPSLSSISPRRSSRLHPVFARSCCRYVRPTLARPCERVHRSASLTNSPLILQQCPSCLVRLIWMVFAKGSLIWVSKKRNNKESIICLTPKTSKSFFVCKAKKKFFTEKELFKESGERRIEHKTKRRLLTALVTGIQKDPTTSIIKHTNELKVYEKTLRTAIKPHLSQDIYPLDYAIWGALENKTNATSHLRSRIASLGLFCGDRDETANRIIWEWS